MKGGAFAPAPPEYRGLDRDGVRLLVGTPDGLTHSVFRGIGDHLRPGDLLVVNNSATVAAEADAVLRGRGPVVLHVATPLDDGRWVVELRTAPNAAEPILDATPGDRVDAGGTRLRLLEGYPHDRSSPSGAGNRLWLAEQLPAHLWPNSSPGRAGRSPTVTCADAFRSRRTRRSSGWSPAVPRCPVRHDRSSTGWSPRWSLAAC